LSEALGADFDWLALGPMPDETEGIAAKYGVAHLDRIRDPKLDRFSADPWVEAMAQYCAQSSPRSLLFSQTYDARLVAPRLAGRLGSAVVMNGIELKVNGDDRLQVTASAYGGDTRVVSELTGPSPHIVAAILNATVPEPLETPSPATVREIRVDLDSAQERIRVVEEARTQGPRLEDADVIVAGGRGLGSAESYDLVRQLADAVGGLAGASRPIVDDGWVDPARQVGLTGKITRPSLYIAAGISGASQHMAGCSAAKTIVAINSDADAAIFRHARYGIVHDCLEILPELIRAVREQ
jgi:electron transfer flavoprotein alpha subunit